MPAPKGKKCTLTSKAPAGGYRDFLLNEARYEHLVKLQELYAEV